MAKGKKKQPHKVEMVEGKKAIIRNLLPEYDIQSPQDMQEVLSFA